MALFFQSTTLDLVIILCVLVISLLAYYKYSFTYWKKRGLKYFPPSIPFGNVTQIFIGKNKCSVGEGFKQLYDRFKAEGEKHGGIYFLTTPVYIPVDPEIVKHIMLTDFSHFVNHGGYVNEDVDPLSGHLFALPNEKWRNLRVKLTPTFTSGKMRMMFDTLLGCTESLKAVLDDQAENGTPVNIKDILSRYTTDIIGSTAFGIECDTLKDPDSKFRKYGRLVSNPDLVQNVRYMMQGIVPYSVLKKFNFRLYNKSLGDFFSKVVKDTIEYRENNNISRKDYMHLLLQLKNRGEVSDDENITSDDKPGMYLTINQIIANSFIFFLAGYETSATTNTFALYELANNQDIQEKLREEINKVLNKHGKLTYEAIKEMTYMDKVVQESLRKYPPAPQIMRECNKSYTVPGTSVTIDKGGMVMISILGLHRDPEHYPNPDKFDPERFSEEEKNKRHKFAYIPFGEGPRQCIGMRFALLQIKVGLAAIVKNYRITINSKTKEPIQMIKNNFALGIDGNLWLNLETIH